MSAAETVLRELLESAKLLIADQAQQLSDQAQQLSEQLKRIADLEAVVEAFKEKLDQNSSNSGKPPSSDSPATRDKNRAKRKRKANTRKRGGQPGHNGKWRGLVPLGQVDLVRDFFPGHCENCWKGLVAVVCEAPRRYQVVELNTTGPELTEYRRHRVTCESCGYQSWAAHSPEIPRFAFGPRLSSIVAMLTGTYHLSRRQTRRLFHELFRIKISLGTISAIERRMSAALAPVYAEAQDIADAAPIKHTDGTGWRQAGRALQLWTVATPTVSVFSIVTNGAAATLRSLFGRIKGILISDRATALNFWAMKRRQICWSHLLRKFIYFSERDGPAGPLGTELVEATGIVFDTYRLFSSGEISRRVFRQRMAPLRAQIESLLERGRDASLRRVSGACKNILRHRQALWNFVDRLRVEPTNNHAERELRSFVLWRKSSFGTQSDSGNRFAERLMTVAHSLRKQQRSLLAFLVDAFRRFGADDQPPSLAVIAA